jgi:hypothetical protein
MPLQVGKTLLHGANHMTVASPPNPDLQIAIRSCVQALRQVANYALPPTLDQQIVDLGERKEFLNQAERDQLLALVAFTQQRTVEKLQAKLALSQLKAFFPAEVPL